MSETLQQPARIDAVAVTSGSDSAAGRLRRSKGIRIALAIVGMTVLDGVSRWMSSGSKSSSLPAISVVQLSAAGSMSLVAACVVRFLLLEIHLTYLRCDLDRRQKGESWSLEGAIALSIYPALSLWLNSSGWTRFASTIHILTVLSVCLAGSSINQLMRQIQRFSPGFTIAADQSAKQRQSKAGMLLLAVLAWNVMMSTSEWSTRIGDTVSRLWLGLCRWIIEQVALPESIDLLTAGLNSLGQMLSLTVMSVWISLAAPLVLCVLVHAHLSRQQGQRLAQLRELLAGFAWMSLCMGLVGPQSIRSASSLIALLCLGWVHATYNLAGLEAYLRRMRQLR